jgi:2-polyprenyl-3-methyl-5-hydroxy-6-metoxy-1,4-benzoquinol methylase
METDDALRAYYERGMERERLSDGRGDLEFTRTTEIVLRRLPAAPAVVADIGGGPGRYALWLASLGYQVEHRDLMPLHVEQLAAEVAGMAGIHTAVGDVRHLDLPDASVDAVLLLGPLYHLTDRAERVRALRECARIVRPNGPVFAAAISRWAARIDGMLRERLYLTYPAALDLIDEIDRTGMLPPLHEGAFTAFCHRPGELREELEEAGLEVGPGERRGTGVHTRRPGRADGGSGGPVRCAGGGTGHRAGTRANRFRTASHRHRMREGYRVIAVRSAISLHRTSCRAQRVRSESWLMPATRARSSLVASSLPGAAV